MIISWSSLLSLLAIESATTSGKAMPPAVDIFKIFLLNQSYQHETLR